MPPLRLLSEFLLDLNTSVVNDLESPTKAILRIEESIYMGMNLKFNKFSSFLYQYLLSGVFTSM